MLYTNQELGQLGEKLARRFLEERNYEIISQNFKSKTGEIDIIAKEKKDEEEEIVVFVEVKTRTSLEFGNPSEAVNKAKQEHILKTAKYFLHSNNMEENNIRFDVIEVFIYKGRYRVSHIKQIM